MTIRSLMRRLGRVDAEAFARGGRVCTVIVDKREDDSDEQTQLDRQLAEQGLVLAPNDQLVVVSIVNAKPGQVHPMSPELEGER